MKYKIDNDTPMFWYTIDTVIRRKAVIVLDQNLWLNLRRWKVTQGQYVQFKLNRDYLMTQYSSPDSDVSPGHLCFVSIDNTISLYIKNSEVSYENSLKYHLKNQPNLLHRNSEKWL